MFALIGKALFLGVAIYNITLHPLAKIPGPKCRGAFDLMNYWDVLMGTGVSNSKALHDQYGDTVRVTPNTVSFTNGVAWQEIYGQQRGKKTFPKDTEAYGVERDGVPVLISAPEADHTRMRRLIKHAFSEGALREQEPLMNVYFDLLIQKLHQKVEGPENGKVNLVHWFNYTAFDVVGDLCFGESFDALREESYGGWVGHIFGSVKFVRLIRVMLAYPVIGIPILFAFVKLTNIQKSRLEHIKHTRDKTLRRLDNDTDRKDFMSYILRHNDEKGMSREEITKLTSTLIIAGSETSATLLSGAIYNLLSNSTTISKLTTEIRTLCPDPKDMTFLKLASAPYLNACLQEALRVYPSLPALLPRKTVAGGAVINGIFIPENTTVGVPHYAAYHSAENFTEPESYIPERWLDDRPARFESDKRSAWQPFSVGPRNCIGQHMAWATMRAMLARVVWHFDLSLCEESKGWNEQLAFVFWEKPDLMVKLKVRE